MGYEIRDTIVPAKDAARKEEGRSVPFSLFFIPLPPPGRRIEEVGNTMQSTTTECATRRNVDADARKVRLKFRKRFAVPR